MGIELKDTLAVKYRPVQYSDLVGNKKSIDIITGYFKMNKLVKAFVLSGNSGSGKTTLARLMAMTVNCQNLEDGEFEPCMECESCKLALAGNHPDIMEINAGGDEGKTEGIDKILNTLKLKPRYNVRVVILDEAHLLASSRAKEKLLKPIEEPSTGVMWILATTDPDKLPKALLGRCSKIYLTYPYPIDTAKKMMKILKAEYDSSIKTMLKPLLIPIAEATYGQVRNSLSILETMASLCSANPDITEDEMKNQFKEIILSVGDLDTLAIRFFTYLMVGSYGLPMSICVEIEQSRVNEFLSVSTRYAQYSAMWFSYYYDKKLGLDRFSDVRRKYWGVNFMRLEEALNKLNTKLTKQYEPVQIVEKAINVAGSLISAIEKTRSGTISSDQAIMYAISSFITVTGGIKAN